MEDGAQNIQLTRSSALDLLLKTVEKCNYSFLLAEAEVINRSVRFFKDQNQLLESITIDEEKAMDILVKGITICHSRKALTLDECAIAFYCIEFLKDKTDKGKKTSGITEITPTPPTRIDKPRTTEN